VKDRIVHRYLDSPLGDMIAGTRETGVCLLEWRDRGGVDRIRERVEKRYRLPLSEGDHPHLRLLSNELRAYFEGSLETFSVPIAVTGTAFEQQTWRQLLQIPYGETRSYGEMAALLGKPGGARAVGRANGANYLAIVIPCHRVIETGGGLGGYGGKLWRKKKLLELESCRLTLL